MRESKRAGMNDPAKPRTTLQAADKRTLEFRNALDEVEQSDVKLRRAIDTIPTLAWRSLPDGSKDFLNKRWRDYTGLSDEESFGWGWQAAVHPEDLPTLLETWRKLRTSEEPGEMEVRVRRHDGVYRWFLIRVEPFRDETGKVVNW